MFSIDTNVLIRYIVQDDENQALKATQFIESINPEEPAFISSLVLCELNWVLKSAYKIPKSQCIEVISKLLSVSIFQIESLDLCLKAIRKYEEGEADFSDYLIQEISSDYGFNVIVTFDQKALKQPGFKGL